MSKVLLIIGLLFATEDQIFKVDFLGIPAARVELNIADTVYNMKQNKQINFQTKSISLVNFFFHVNNRYETITTPNIKTILSFNKNTIQPNISNQLQTSNINNKIIYDNSSIVIPNNYFNIFSLLYFLSQNKIINITSINIEREGMLYSGKITPVKFFKDNKILYDLQLMKKVSLEGTTVIKNTDIFTWALFRQDSKREILVDYNNNNIVECIFKYGKIKMTARNSKYFK